MSYCSSVILFLFHLTEGNELFKKMARYKSPLKSSILWSNAKGPWKQLYLVHRAPICQIVHSTDLKVPRFPTDPPVVEVGGSAVVWSKSLPWPVQPMHNYFWSCWIYSDRDGMRKKIISKSWSSWSRAFKKTRHSFYHKIRKY